MSTCIYYTISSSWPLDLYLENPETMTNTFRGSSPLACLICRIPVSQFLRFSTAIAIMSWQSCGQRDLCIWPSFAHKFGAKKKRWNIHKQNDNVYSMVGYMIVSTYIYIYIYTYIYILYKIHGPWKLGFTWIYSNPVSLQTWVHIHLYSTGIFMYFPHTLSALALPTSSIRKSRRSMLFRVTASKSSRPSGVATCQVWTSANYGANHLQ